jgi:protein CWC15
MKSNFTQLKSLMRAEFYNSSSSSDSDDSDDEDETAELMRELEKIKRERAEQKAREEQARLDEELAQKEEEALTGNPLLSSSTGGFMVKKRWDEDVIFKNQAKGQDDKPKKRFINDMIRSDFHRKFMSKCECHIIESLCYLKELGVLTSIPP